MPDGSSLLFGAVPHALRFSSEQKRVVRRFARALVERVGGGQGFTCLIADDGELRRLNREFLRHDYATDVLSFPTASGHGSLGDIAISAERAAAQAKDFGHTTIDEIRILMLHGLLHLTGLDHEQDRGEMRRAEDAWRTALELPRGVISRVSRARRRA